jgi:hypothetical protein
MKPVLILRMVADQRCAGCSAANCYVDEKSRFCCYCMGFALATAGRIRKLNTTLRQKFARRLVVFFKSKHLLLKGRNV